MARFIRRHRRMLQKTGTYYVMHVTVAAAVAYAVTGDLLMAFTLSLLEPTVQAVAFFVHEKLWARAASPEAALAAAA
ncbi:DUF2061 domain-containing protein [Ottowia testudinis]|uniref:DUF2061 domain-containing protein n=1 Tax=Ottowia testudinis TaxID=2816950 RepID=A0A975CFP0_9BURK|nr:DUF2061 domain-containing protein [Ottowia testudinis]QTD45545.1 DUF2061 domain-containing protein [Ottowia testudinis]